jgi:alpha-tubulin suppressor-like RCC1 family protein/subtilisin family serine protease/fibronectin type 3 domain-containing protein
LISKYLIGILEPIDRAMKAISFRGCFRILLASVICVCLFTFHNTKKSSRFEKSADQRPSSRVANAVKPAHARSSSRNSEFKNDTRARIETHQDNLTSFISKGEVLDEREKQTAQAGVVVRSKLIRTHFKYPYVRTQETVVKDSATSADQSIDQTAMVADHLLIRLKAGASFASLERLAEKFGGSVSSKLPNTETYIVTFEANKANDLVDQMAHYAQQNEIVAYVEPDYFVQSLSVPNDPKFGQLWSLNNTKQTGGKLDADIDAPEAWDFSTGSRSVKVAVIDSGIDYTHPDLSANIWANPGEIAENGIDDDHNGFIDDIRGWNFVSASNDPRDDNFHGTQMAGVVGAVGNNGYLMAGVCWQVSMIPVKFLDAEGLGVTSDAAAAISYASKVGADVSLCPWGGTSYSQVVRDAIAEADTKGVLFVTAAGNGGVDLVGDDNDITPFYPAGYDLENIISVGSLNYFDKPAPSSNYGIESVDVFAPGETIRTTYPMISTEMMDGRMPTEFGVSSGTSFAAAHVAGACALVKAYQSSLTPMQVKQLVVWQSDPLPDLVGKCRSEARVNAYQGLRSSASMVNVAITSPSYDSSHKVNGSIPIQGTASGLMFQSYQIYYRQWNSGSWGAWNEIGSISATPVANGTLGTWNLAGIPAGAYQLKLEAVSTDGIVFKEIARVFIDNLAAPTHLLATELSSNPLQVGLGWRDNSTDELGFKIERKTGQDGVYSEIASVAAGTTNYTDASSGLLADGTVYYYRVRAWNGSGNSFYSNEDKAPKAKPPAAPVNLIAILTGPTSVDLTWEDPSSNEWYFKLERRKDAAGYTQITTIDPDNTTYSDLDLEEGHQYTYRIRAFGEGGDSDYSNEATAESPQRLQKPTLLTARALSGEDIELSWRDNSNNEEGFLIQRKDFGGTFVDLDQVQGTSYVDHGLTRGTKYVYRVCAYDFEGLSRFSNEAEATTQTAPFAPMNLDATAVSSSQIDLTWTDASDVESSFAIERRESSGDFNEVARVNSNVTSYSDTGLAEWTRYTYRVRAFSPTAGYSDYSNESSTKTLGALYGALACGLNHSVALDESGRVWVWGDNRVGQLGNGTKTSRATPLRLTTISDVIEVAAGDSHTVVIKSDGKVYAWGSNSKGQLGDNSKTDRKTPIAVTNLSSAIQVDGGSSFTLALLSDGTVRAWGENGMGQLGDGSKTDRKMPVPVAGLNNIIEIAAGGMHSLALSADGTVYSWGNNGQGQLGNGMKQQASIAKQISGLTGVVHVAAGDSHSIALKSDGTVWSWGSNDYGQLGDGTTSRRNIPAKIVTLNGIMAVSAGHSHTLAISTSGQVFSWGKNRKGQIGDGSSVDRLSPTSLGSIVPGLSIAGGEAHTLGLQGDGTVWSWGLNSSGQLGDGTSMDHLVPQPLSNLDLLPSE